MNDLYFRLLIVVFDSQLLYQIHLLRYMLRSRMASTSSNIFLFILPFQFLKNVSKIQLKKKQCTTRLAIQLQTSRQFIISLILRDWSDMKNKDICSEYFFQIFILVVSHQLFCHFRERNEYLCMIYYLLYQCL